MSANKVMVGRVLIVLSTLITPIEASNFRRQNDARLSMREEAEASLMEEMAATFRPGATKDRIHRLEGELKPMFTAAPQNEDGTVSHSVVRYVLHRFFAQRGWFIQGLEPVARNLSSDGGALQGVHAWVPSFLQEFLEELHGGRGIGVRVLAVLAATLEDVVHKESNYNLMSIISVTRGNHLPTTNESYIMELLENYMVNFELGNLRPGGHGVRDTGTQKQHYITKRKDWPAVVEWMRSVRWQVHPSGRVDVDALMRIVEAIAEQYGLHKDKQCGQLKSELLSMESKKAGRVRLADFYYVAFASSLEGDTKFNEQFDYLKTLGAIDESDFKDPYVIVPNYIASRANCVSGSELYSVCCRNECEELMGKLEHEVKDELAEAGHILQLVEGFSTGTVDGKLPLALTQRLYGIATVNGGAVPLHGRLFAQWMHHAFPRECPFPHEDGSVKPQAPDKWMEETGRNDARLSHEELAAHVYRNTSLHVVGNNSIQEHLMGSNAWEHHALPENELPWTETEELLMPITASQSHRQFRDTLRITLFCGTVSSMAFAAKWLFPRSKYVGLELKMV